LEHYLGFVVARPLPQAIIGKTILRPYSSDRGRQYPCVRNYDANLFGIPLRIKSLAYQQQDTVLAACATVALWSCLHMTAELFGTACPRPATITRIANQVVGDARPLPSRGLRLEQICHALRTFDLEAEVVHISEKVPLISLMRAYLCMGIPVLMLLVAGNLGHVVAVTGYRMQDNMVRTEEVPGGCIPMLGLCIDRFFAHDDAMGPFSKLLIMGPGTRPNDNVKVPVVFESNHKTAPQGPPLPLYPVAVILPVYNKIRLTFLELQEWLERLHFVISSVWPDLDGMMWEIELTMVNTYKTQQRNLGMRSQRVLEPLLLKPQPRFIWRSLLRSADKTAVLEILADATEVKDSVPFYDLEVFSAAHRDILVTELKDKNNEKILIDVTTEPFFDFLRRWAEAQVK
jgi:hypothetical protein